MNKKKLIISIIINSIVSISAFTVIIIGVFFSKVDRDLSVKGINYLRYFTNLSGLLAGISSLIILIYNIRALKGNNTPLWAIRLHLVASTGVMITFLTVVFFLAPVYSTQFGYFGLFLKDMFHMHFFNCVLEMISFTFVVTLYEFKIKDIIIGAIAVPIYSLVYMPLVLTGTWPDFYNFTLGGHFELTPIAMLIMYSLSFLVSFTQAKIHNKLIKKHQAN